MKLKYYLRGLGIGIVVTAVVLSVSGKGHTKELTDTQIKIKAKELGMVEKSVLSDMLDDDAESKVQAKPVQEDTAENKNSISNNSISNNSISNNSVESGTKAADKNESPEKTADVIKEIAENENQKVYDTKETEEQNTDNTANKNQKNSVIVITVESGESSLSICKKLEKAGLIDSASEFDQYLCQNGYDKKICTGDHHIAKDATNGEIARAIISK